VASFLISAYADPLLSIKSVASFFEKLSAFSRQPSASRSPEAHVVPHFAICPLPFAFCRSLLLAYGPLNPSDPQNGGFVPHFRKVRSFVINQIGGFVF